jgi:hypothetical protein
VSASKKAKAARKGAADSFRQRNGGKGIKNREPKGREHSSAPIPLPALNEVWWCAVNHDGIAVWSYLDLTMSNVAEILTKNEGKYWEARGWRIAKLQVTEI